MDLIKLQIYLTEHYPQCFLIPALEGGKRPKFAHKDGKYNAKMFLDTGFNQCQSGCLIILTGGLIIIDIDDHDYVDTFVRIPAFAKTVSCKTQKGRHFYFNRTPLCDLNNIFDSSRILVDDDEALPIDIKSCNRNQDVAPGTISIPPSPNKTWEVPPIDNPILDLPDKFVEFYKTYLVDNKKTSDIKDKYPGIVDNTYTRKDLYRYLNMLKPFRCCEWTYWIRIGFALHNYSPDLLDLWDSWSKNCVSKYDGKCWKDWNKMDKPYGKKCTLATLFYFAQQDNPKAFSKLHGEGRKQLTLEEKTIIKKFINDNYGYTSDKIPDDNISTYRYNDLDYISVNINELYCKISECEHKSPKIWINIGLSISSEKCRECNYDRINEIKYREYSPELQRVYKNINPEIAPKDNQRLIGDYFIEISKNDDISLNFVFLS